MIFFSRSSISLSIAVLFFRNEASSSEEARMALDKVSSSELNELFFKVICSWF